MSIPLELFHYQNGIKKSIKIFNNGNNKLDIKGKIQNLEQLTFFKDGGVEYKFELNPNETKEIEINFLSKKDMEAGVYPGKVVFTSNGIERTVSFIVEVESEKPLFDVKVEILSEYKKVYPSDKVVAQLTIYNLGKIGKVVVNVEYGIKDLSGKIIATENENLTVETQLSVLKALNTSSTLKPDNYVFFGKVNYKNIVGTGSDMFQLLEKPKFALSFNYFLLIFLILLIILAVYILKKVNKRKKK